jgi:hypothetical protein
MDLSIASPVETSIVPGYEPKLTLYFVTKLSQAKIGEIGNKHPTV